VVYAFKISSVIIIITVVAIKSSINAKYSVITIATIRSLIIVLTALNDDIINTQYIIFITIHKVYFEKNVDAFDALSLVDTSNVIPSLESVKLILFAVYQVILIIQSM